MSWSTTVLSTLESIARHDKDVNKLAGYTSRPAIKATSDEYSITFTEKYEAFRLIKPDLTTISVETLKTPYILHLPVGVEIIGIIAIYEGDKEAYYELLEGRGITITERDTITTGALSSAALWTTARIDRTWSDKIDLAKEIIYNELQSRGFSVYDIDSFANTATLAIASDYKTLCLIYQDMSTSTASELYEAKYRMYKICYNDEINKAITRLSPMPDIHDVNIETYRIYT